MPETAVKQDYIALIKDYETDNSDLFKRMDEDRDLAQLKAYVMQGKKGPITNVVNMTMNIPAILKAYVESSLNNTTRQLKVTSLDTKFDTKYVEDFITAALDAASERIENLEMFPIDPFFSEQFTIRGRAAARVVLRPSKVPEEGTIVDISPWDTRFVSEGFSPSAPLGVDWRAYQLTRKKTAIETERWAEDIKGDIPKKAKVTELWSPKENIIYLEGKEVFRQANPWGFVPVIHRMVTLGSMTADEDSQQYWGESVFWLIRGLIPEMNRLMSIIQTLNMQAIKRAVMEKRKLGGEATPYDDLTGAGVSVRIEPDEDIEPIDLGDLRQSMQVLYMRLEKALQEGGFTVVDIGNPNQPFSGLALMQIGENRDQFLRPRMQTKARFMEALAHQLIRMAIQMGGTIELGRSGHKRPFDARKLEGQYSIEFQYFAQSPTMDMARIAAANAAAPWYTRRKIIEDILQDPDPQKVEDDFLLQKVRAESPAIDAMQTVEDLEAMGKKDWAQIYAQERSLLFKQQVAAGQLAPPAAGGQQSGLTKPGQNADFAELFNTAAQSGQSVAGQKSADLKKKMEGKVNE